jgi:hypothetical protein
MNFKDYIWFWRTSWHYMEGSRKEFWIRIIPVTFKYRKSVLEDKKACE